MNWATMAVAVVVSVDGCTERGGNYQLQCDGEVMVEEMMNSNCDTVTE